ncbi:MAG: cell wall hydrolase [Coprococcus sp.]
MNRVASPLYPNTISGVVYQSGQFAPTWDGSLSRVLQRGPVSLCYQVAQEALGGARLASVSGCYQFRSASTGMSGINVGGNVFF